MAIVERLDCNKNLNFAGFWWVGLACERPTGSPKGGGGTPHMKGVGMFLVSLKGVNFGFWSHLGCSGQNAIIFRREGLVTFRVAREKI